jgi:putative oxidoreductase
MATVANRYNGMALRLPSLLKEKTWAHFIVFAGRACFSAIFILSSFNHFTKGAVDFAGNQGVPLPQILVPFSGVLALFGGISVLTGFRARFGAVLIMLFLLPVTLMMHNFWSVPDPAMAALQQIMFMKNLSMLGGALLVFYFGAGPMSIDGARTDVPVL